MSVGIIVLGTVSWGLRYLREYLKKIDGIIDTDGPWILRFWHSLHYIHLIAISEGFVVILLDKILTHLGMVLALATICFGV